MLLLTSGLYVSVVHIPHIRYTAWALSYAFGLLPSSWIAATNSHVKSLQSRCTNWIWHPADSVLKSIIQSVVCYSVLHTSTIWPCYRFTVWWLKTPGRVLKQTFSKVFWKWFNGLVTIGCWLLFTMRGRVHKCTILAVDVHSEVKQHSEMTHRLYFMPYNE